MTQQYEFLSRLRDAVHELQVLVDEAIAEESRTEEERDKWQRRFRTIRGGAS